MQKPLILISNDDSIESKGIKILTEIMTQLGEVVVVAPDTHQSGMGHAITLDRPLRVQEVPDFVPNVKAYKCSGTPADCVKFGKHFVCKGRKIDLVVSGINHGSNSSIAVMILAAMPIFHILPNLLPKLPPLFWPMGCLMVLPST